MQQPHNKYRNPFDSEVPIHSSCVAPDFTEPQAAVRVYSNWGHPSDNIGKDGDFVFEEITSSLVGPKVNGKWPEDLVRIEGPVLGKRGAFPRWKAPHQQHREKWFTRCSKALLTFLLTGHLRRPKLLSS